MTLTVELAGYNIDASVANKATYDIVAKDQLTPETISAAYARISRSSASIHELRNIAIHEVEKSRATNKRVVFDMGHTSIAEHAVLNFDISGISRLAIEWLESFRLCSFTEKSQRYVDLDHDHVLPFEIQGTAYQNDFESLLKKQADAYEVIYKNLLNRYLEKSDSTLNRKEKVFLDGKAKEDARYVSSLATTGQLGMTVNARNLEHIIQRAASSAIVEINELGELLYHVALAKVPSLLRYVESSDFEVYTKASLRDLTSLYAHVSDCMINDVSLVNCTHDIDRYLAAILLMSHSTLPFDACIRSAENLDEKNIIDLFLEVFSRKTMYESVYREFEHIVLTFEVVLSASAYAQLKRHRMTTQSVQPYALSLGLTIPPAIASDDVMNDEMMQVVMCASELYARMGGAECSFAAYALTNAHRRRILITLNLRELYHMASLREDIHAQWDIRDIVGKMTCSLKERAPYASLMLCGKDSYETRHKEIFGE